MRYLSLAAMLAAFLALAPPARGQSISGGELDRAYRPGAYVPYDGAPFSHRYNYYTGPSLFLNGDARQLYMMDYLDRVDRAARFGYPEPAPPNFLPDPPRTRWHFGVFIHGR